MTIRSVTYYQVVCDAPDCGVSTEDCGGDFSAFAGPGWAEDDWNEGNQTVQLADDQTTLHFCHNHSIPVCSFCDEVRDDLTTGSDGTTLACGDCIAEGEVTA